jgi:hypothetical protein
VDSGLFGDREEFTMMHQCPKCELRFAYQTELDYHCRNDHPTFHHEYPVRGEHHVYEEEQPVESAKLSRDE